MFLITSTWTRLAGRIRYFFSLPATRRTPLRCLWRVLFWRICCLLKKGVGVYVKSWKLKVWLPPAWKGGGTTQFFIARELYEPELAHIGKFLKPGQTFIDAGANIGLYTLAASSIVGSNGKIFAFEPESRALAALKNNIARNRLQHVQIVEAALSDSDGQAVLFGRDQQSVSASLGSDGAGNQFTQQIKTMRLDTFLQGQGGVAVHVMKMDVEGAEALLLRGAEETIQRNRPIIIFEVNESAAQTLNLPPFAAWDFLAALNYQFLELSDEGLLNAAQKPDYTRNIIALHKS